MQRRVFLRICSAAAVASTAGGMAGLWLAPRRHGLSLTGRALFPGVPLNVEVLADAPSDAQLRLVVEHDGQTHLGTAQAVAGGQMLRVETPYPHEELVPGTYLVRVELVDQGGVLIERHAAGGYELGRPWFSA